MIDLTDLGAVALGKMFTNKAISSIRDDVQEKCKIVRRERGQIIEGDY